MWPRPASSQSDSTSRRERPARRRDHHRLERLGGQEPLRAAREQLRGVGLGGLAHLRDLDFQLALGGPQPATTRARLPAGRAGAGLRDTSWRCGAMSSVRCLLGLQSLSNPQPPVRPGRTTFVCSTPRRAGPTATRAIRSRRSPTLPASPGPRAEPVRRRLRVTPQPRLGRQERLSVKADARRLEPV